MSNVVDSFVRTEKLLDMRGRMSCFVCPPRHGENYRRCYRMPRRNWKRYRTTQYKVKG